MRGSGHHADACVRSHVEESKLPLLGGVGDGSAVGEHADGIDLALGEEGAHTLAGGDVPQSHLVRARVRVRVREGLGLGLLTRTLTLAPNPNPS